MRNINTSPNQDIPPPPVLLYRGVAAHNNERIGRWWSTNPYYALGYAHGGKGDMFVAAVDRAELLRLAKDVSLDEDLENYLFEDDPPGARLVTAEEVDALRQHTTFSRLPIGGEIMKRPDDAVEIGQKVFGQSVGQIALPATVERPATEESP